jgi:uncharacterized membrane protein YdjX (TVP38/TMEM64 family)
MQHNEQYSPWGIGITLVILFGLAFFIDLNNVKDWVIGAGAWGPLIFILLKISTIIVAPLTGTPLYLLVGLFFGFWPGILYIAIADTIGHTISFSISRFFGQKVVLHFISKKEGGLLHRIINHVGTPKGFFQAYLTLFSMPELLSYGAGLTTLPYRKFISMIVPLSLVTSSALVLFGSVLDISKNAGLIAFIMPGLGFLVFVLGGWLFVKAVKK